MGDTSLHQEFKEEFSGRGPPLMARLWGLLRSRHKEHSILLTHASQTNKFFIHPESRIAVVWQFYLGISILWLSFYLPIQVFPYGFDEYDGLNFITTLLDVSCIIDLFLNFRTGFVKGAEVEMGPKEIATHYMRGWFVFDLLGSIPFEYFIATEKTTRKATKVYKLTKLSKLFRVGRIVKYLKQYFKFRYIMILAFASLVIMHWGTCIWFILVGPDSLYTAVEVGNVNLASAYVTSLNGAVLALFSVRAIEASSTEAEV